MILLLTSLILDGFLSTIIPINSFLRPKLTVTTIYLLYPKYKNNKKIYFIYLVIIGLIYDILYTNILLFHPIVFIILGNFIKYIKDNYNKTPSLLGLILTIICYEIIIFSLINIFQISKTNIIYLLTLIINSIVLNAIYLKIMTLLSKIKHN